MTIIESSAEFKLNSDFGHNMFGIPKFFESGKFGDIVASQQHVHNISMPFAKEDIDKLWTWESTKNEISGAWNSHAKIWKDVNSNYWIQSPGSGYAIWWSVGLGDLESGKYPV